MFDWNGIGLAAQNTESLYGYQSAYTQLFPSVK